MTLTYERLLAGIAGEVAGVRCVREFEPMGGPGDKVFPPTYGVDGPRDTLYATESRVARGASGEVAPVTSVVLDSVASQANRYELALLEAIRSGRLGAPVTSVDFSPFHLYGIGRISDYEAPHRIFDAILRDSFDGDLLFREGVIGRAITDAVPRNAGAMLRHSPHTLVFGGWDSTGPKGGRGAKYERALTSEIVAYDVQAGVKTSSRIDPLGIEKTGDIFRSRTDVGWTSEQSEADQDDRKPVLYKRGGAKAGTPAVINHGNVRPSIEARAGGITAGRIAGTTVLSFVQLRRLRFPVDAHGAPIQGVRGRDAEVAARAALAALGLAAMVLAQDEGFDLRSRCVLVPNGPLTVAIIQRSGGVETVSLDAVGALALAAESTKRASEFGLGWRSEELMLRPSDRLVALVRKSQEAAVAGGEEG